MLPTLGKILWLKAGRKADGYYQPTINEDKTSYRYPLRSSFWNTANDILLGEITDTNQADMDPSLSTTRFIEFKDNSTGEIRYILYSVDSFDMQYEVREPEVSVTEKGLSFFRRYRLQILLGAVVTVALVFGKSIKKAFSKWK